jgi:alanine dehydrogenase
MIRSGEQSPKFESYFQVQEETLELGKKGCQLFIGLPKEDFRFERRIGLTPDAVKLLVNHGHRIRVETGAGEAAFYTDHDYSEAGAEIAYNTKEVYQADIIFKIAPPNMTELEYLRPNQTLLSAVQVTPQHKMFYQKLLDKKINAIAFDYLTDEKGVYPVVRSMGEIAGGTSILIASEYLSNTKGGKGLLMGGISGVPSTEVIILGAGNAGEFAARAALGLGASVKVFDNSLYRLRRLQNDIHTRLYTCVLQPNILEKHLRRADVVIGAMRPAMQTPCIVTEDMVRRMKPGSVIVDISIDRGGCFETSELRSHESPTFVKHDIIHYCVPNISSRVARTASFSLSNIFVPIILSIADEGGVKTLIRNDEGVRNGTYIYQGKLTHKGMSEMLALPFTDLRLLLTAM